MSYVPATITLTFNQSSWEQVEPSTVGIDCKFTVIGNYEKKELSVYNKMRFLRMGIDKLIAQMNTVAYEDGLTKGESLTKEKK